MKERHRLSVADGPVGRGNREIATVWKERRALGRVGEDRWSPMLGPPPPLDCAAHITKD